MNLLNFLSGGKYLFVPSLFFSLTFTKLTHNFTASTAENVAGFTVGVWLFAIAFSAWNFYTGLMANKTELLSAGEYKGFSKLFDRSKAMKFIERVIGFILVVAFISRYEEQMLTFGNETTANVLSYLKSFFFFFVCMVELKSIGDNNERRFGTKGFMFSLLDKLVVVFENGIINKAKKQFELDEDNNS